MNLGLSLIMIIFAIFWTCALIWCIKTDKISIKYSLVWFFATIVIFLVGTFPDVFYDIAHFFNFDRLADFVVGILITLLLAITMVLTIIVTTLKTTVRLLIQEISLLKKELKDKK